MDLSILGIGTVSALGSGVQTLREGLQGKIKPNIEEKIIPAADGEKKLLVYQPVAEGIDRFIPKRALRRVDQFAQLALLSTHLAIEDAGIEFDDKSRVGVVFGSGYGPTRTTFKFLDNVINDGDIGASPTHFANSVHNALASQVSIFLGLTGPCSTVTCFEHSLSNVLITAKDWLNQDLVDYVLVGLGDEYCDVLGYAAAGMNSGKANDLNPLDFENCTFLPGEGHITFLISNEKSEQQGYAKISEIQMRKNVEEINSIISDDPVIVNASGKVDQGKTLSKLKQNRLKSYTSLYGGMPTSSAFDLAVACLSFKDKKLYPVPGLKDNKEVLDNTIACLEFCQEDEFNVYRLKL
jgi:3-oxoacyl-[acyl-carrier-protein] synthase II